MEESSKLKVQEQKIDIDNDKEVQESDSFPHDKNNDLYQVKVESKPNEHEYHLDEENEEVNIQVDSSVKNIFIRKVFGILSIKYFLFYSCVLILHRKESIRREIVDNYDTAENILFYSSILFAIMFLVLLIFRKFFKIVPFNYFFFFGISLSEIASFSVISTLYYYHIVSISLLLTFIASIIIIIYSLIEKEDYSYLKLGLLVFFAQLLIIWFILVFFEIKVWYMIFTFFSMTLLGNFFVYDTLTIVDKFGQFYSVDDYIFATLEIYIEAAKTILFLLKTFGQSLCKKCIKKKYNKI